MKLHWSQEYSLTQRHNKETLKQKNWTKVSHRVQKRGKIKSTNLPRTFRKYEKSNDLVKIKTRRKQTREFLFVCIKKQFQGTNLVSMK